MRNRSIVPFLIPSSAVALFLLAPVLTSAQTAGVQPRITAAVDETKLVALRGNTHPLARPEFDRGAAPSSLPMQRMLLVLKRSPEQETALDALLDQQLDTSSPSYHQWLTPPAIWAAIRSRRSGHSDGHIVAAVTRVRCESSLEWPHSDRVFRQCERGDRSISY